MSPRGVGIGQDSVKATADAGVSFDRLLWWLFAAGTGGGTRLRVLLSLREEPKNAQRLAQELTLDYTTVRHHLKVLESNGIVVAEGGKYGRVYFVSDLMESRWTWLETINSRKARRTGKVFQ